MKAYPLIRDDAPLMWLREDDTEQGVIYVYVLYADRVDVLKMHDGTAIRKLIDTHAGMEKVIRVTQPRYRVSAGACTCDGYHFRETCRHATKAKTIGNMRVEISAS